jgi:hypothetical protein
MKLDFSKPTRNKRGQIGAHVFVTFDEGGHHSVQELETHGLSAEQASAEIDELRKWHRRWATRLTALHAIIGVEFVVEGRVYRITSATIPPDRPYDDVEVVLCLREVVGAALQKVDGWPTSLWFQSIDDVPNNPRIIEAVRERLDESAARAAAHNAYKNKVLKGRE